MSGYWYAPEDTQFPEQQLSQGSAHQVSTDCADSDMAEKVREVVEEVTRKSVKRIVRRIGFL